MQPPAALLKTGIDTLPTMGDGRQSGTSGSPSILNVSPEAAVGGGLALLKTGDMVRIDLTKRTANILISDDELAQRRAAFVVRDRLGQGALAPFQGADDLLQLGQRVLEGQRRQLALPRHATLRRARLAPRLSHSGLLGRTTILHPSGHRQNGSPCARPAWPAQRRAA
jgi:hypothetical protein